MVVVQAVSRYTTRSTRSQDDLRTQWASIGRGYMARVARMLVTVDYGRLAVVAIGKRSLPLWAVETLFLARLRSRCVSTRRWTTR